MPSSNFLMVFVIMTNNLLVTMFASGYFPPSFVKSDFLMVDGGHKIYFEVHDAHCDDKQSAGHGAKHNLLYFHGGWGPQTNDLNVVPKEMYRTFYFHQRGWG